jgi:hypothetical protein
MGVILLLTVKGSHYTLGVIVLMIVIGVFLPFGIVAHPLYQLVFVLLAVTGWFFIKKADQLQVKKNTN